MAIDTGLMYLIKSKVSAAADAAALAGARSLNIGGTADEQRARAQRVAESFARLNFPEATLMSSNLIIAPPVVDSSNPNHRSVTVEISVEPPSLFLSMLGVTDSVIRAKAVAVRPNVNVMLVLDRSGSLETANACDDVRSAAIRFIEMFAPSRDVLGLVTFGSSTWTNYAMRSDFTTSDPPLRDVINTIQCVGGTSSAAALSRAYWELAQLNAPEATNVIVFFTDGMPTAIDGVFPAIAPCNGGDPIRGVWTATYRSDGTSASVFGLLRSEFPTLPVPSSDQITAPNSGNCGFADNRADTNGYRNVPRFDVWGNDLLYGYANVPDTVQVDGVTVVSKDSHRSNAAVSMNAAVHAADRIRLGGDMLGSRLPRVTIHAIGLGGASNAAPEAFMERVANTNEAYVSARGAKGTYLYAPSATDLSDMFVRVATTILRLAE